jgi:hypothetical protein
VLRNFLRVVSALAGFCLIWPGVRAVIGLARYDPTPSANPLFDRIAIWLTTVVIWTASLLLLWFAAKKPK